MYTQVIRILKQRGFVEASALLEALTSWHFGKESDFMGKTTQEWMFWQQIVRPE